MYYEFSHCLLYNQGSYIGSLDITQVIPMELGPQRPRVPVTYMEQTHQTIKSFLPATWPGMQCSCVSVSEPVCIGSLGRGHVEVVY